MKKNKLNIALVTLSIYSVLLFLFRIKITNSLFYGFLIWNLFLAYIPFLISTYIKYKNSYKQSKIKFWSLLFIWILFLPNAPYILTDFVHLKQGKSIAYWFDLLLISTFSINGMLLFFISVNDVHKILQHKFSKTKAWFSTIIIFFLCGFGIYLGRFLRFNSWDILHQPQALLQNIIIPFIHPTQHPKTWGVTLGFGLFFSILFLIFNAITLTKQSTNDF